VSETRLHHCNDSKSSPPLSLSISIYIQHNKVHLMHLPHPLADQSTTMPTILEGSEAVIMEKYLKESIIGTIISFKSHISSY
jgi:hypothetical protein